MTTSATNTPEVESGSGNRHLFVVLVLAIGTFAIGTDAFVLAGLLDVVADKAHVSVATAGQLGTSFALVYAFAGPFAARHTGKYPRRVVLAIALSVFALGNAVFAASDSFGWLLAGRVVAAIGAAAFTPAALASVHVLSGARATRHISYVMTGMTAATVIGVPLSSYVAGHAGYSPVFWALAIAGVVIAGVVALTIPGDLRGAAQRPSLLDALRTPGSLTVLVVTLLFFLGAFTTYSYIAAFSSDRLSGTTGLVSAALLAFGLGGLVGNLAAGRFTGPDSALTGIRISLLGAVITFVLISTLPFKPVFVVLAFVWGAWGWSILPSVQATLLKTGRVHGPVLLSLNSSAMYLGISLSGILGGIVEHQFGAWPLPVVSAVIVAVGLALSLSIRRPAAVENESVGQ